MYLIVRALFNGSLAVLALALGEDVLGFIITIYIVGYVILHFIDEWMYQRRKMTLRLEADTTYRMTLDRDGRTTVAKVGPVRSPLWDDGDSS